MGACCRCAGICRHVRLLAATHRTFIACMHMPRQFEPTLNFGTQAAACWGGGRPALCLQASSAPASEPSSAPWQPRPFQPARSAPCLENPSSGFRSRFLPSLPSPRHCCIRAAQASRGCARRDGTCCLVYSSADPPATPNITPRLAALIGIQTSSTCHQWAFLLSRGCSAPLGPAAPVGICLQHCYMYVCEGEEGAQLPDPLRQPISLSSLSCCPSAVLLASKAALLAA